jgi:DNA-directed RNA polymerase delta subunit
MTTKTKSAKSEKRVKLSFVPKQIVKRLLAVLPERAEDVLTRRYGLGKDARGMTLEAIGEIYGITRERVRQIENYALATIRKSEAYEKEQKVIDELEQLITTMGAIVPEEIFLDEMAKDKSTQNHVHFLLVLGHPFVRFREDEYFTHRVEDALKSLYESLSDEELMSESELIEAFISHLKDLAGRYRDEEILKRWLSLSKKIARSPLGDWGRVESTTVSPRGVRDYAYLVILRHGSPLHFSEVARQIGKLFDRRAHTATAHNELIKDPRFVLVGRGLYALSEWGYMQGVVKDVIASILKQSGPLTKEEIVDKVLKERYVKENTIVVNLQDKMFRKTKDGKYAVT